MTPIPERLAALAAQMREDARQAGIDATSAQAAVEQAAAAMGDARRQVEALQDQLTQIEESLVQARQAHDHATSAHAEALATLARFEAGAESAANVAADLDQLAERERARRATPPTPGEALAAAGLPAAGAPLQAAQAPAEVIAALTGGTPVVPPPVPAGPAGQVVAVTGPGVTVPDTGLAGPPLDPPPGEGIHSHARPKDKPRLRDRITGLTGGHPVVTPDELLAEGQRQARPDDPTEADRG